VGPLTLLPVTAVGAADLAPDVLQAERPDVGLSEEGYVNTVPIIAIVDDDVSVLRSLNRLVRSAGYLVETFASAREFLEWLPRGQAACLVLDVYMNEMSGFDLQDRLAVPIIYMTAHDDARTRQRIAKSGAAGHLRKPFDERAILDAIRRAVM
jgi:FixJ family two-component response regulator